MSNKYLSADGKECACEDHLPQNNAVILNFDSKEKQMRIITDPKET
jgi:uncharacterized protein (DUF1330 family)